MQIALAQIDATIGDFAGNAERIRRACREAGDASLVVFPELSLCGYMPRDLLQEPSFLEATRRALEGLAADRSLPPLVVGCPLRAEGAGKPLTNSAVLIRGGEKTVFHKRLLPTYDVFDERRYFRPDASPARPVEIAGKKTAILVCEDSWAGEWTNGVYPRDPVAEAVAAGAEIVINISASPFEHGKPALRRRILASHARRHQVPQVLCNLVGGNDQLLFDGNSFALDARGEPCACGPAFEEGVTTTDLTGSARPDEAEDDTLRALVMGIADYFRKTGYSDALVGMSGGIDSSVTACLAVRALSPGHVTGVAMPGPFSSRGSLEDARLLAEALHIPLLEVSIAEAYRRVVGDLKRAWGERPFDEAEENVQARLRGVVLMALANKRKALVLVPSNKSEMAMGYCTLYGDMVGALGPIADLYKGEIYALARRFREVIPDAVFDKAPSAELRPGQKDSDTLPPYEILDEVLRLHLEERATLDEIVAAGHDRGVAAGVLRAVARSEYKRQQASLVLKVSKKAFGVGRRFPIAQRFREET